MVFGGAPKAGQDTYSSHCVFVVALKALKVQGKANFQSKQLVRLQCGFALSSPFIDSSRAGLWPTAGEKKPAGGACNKHKSLTFDGTHTVTNTVESNVLSNVQSPNPLDDMAG